MTKEEWITAAAAKLQPYEGDNSQAYAESLYQYFVLDMGEYANNPTGAVAIDMTYWE